MPVIPQKRQSVRPPLTMIIAALVAVLALAALWFAVSAAVGSGGEDCPAQKNETTQRCR